MSSKYDFQKIEKKWQKFWLEKKIFKARDDSEKPKYYQLETFPYPSAAGLHVGHPKGYIAEDIHARFMRMNGREVLYTMGWDAFGLPTENYAIKVGKSPQEVARENIKNFKRQLQMFGFSYDWDREINTSSPDYYKWTQWLFIQLYKKGLAYRAKARVNWCPSCLTVLANEQVKQKSEIRNPKSETSVCERCETPVEQREMEQWFLKITDYAERLLNDLNEVDPATNEQVRSSGAGWPEATIKRQKDWIGKSEGAEIEFPVAFGKDKPNFLILHGWTGKASKNFIPWLKTELEKSGFDVQAPELPNTDNPKEDEQVNFVLEHCRIDQNTVIVGHSLGGIVGLKVLEGFGRPIRRLILVAPAIDPTFSKADIEDRPFWETFKWDFNYDKIKNLAPSRTILSDPQEKQRIAYLEFLQKKLDAELVTGIAEREHFCAKEEPIILENILPKIKVFTTRPDTLFGATYMVLAPEHSLIENLKLKIENWGEVQKYIEQARHKTELQRQEESREKTGVELKGVKAINPATKEEIPIWIADYVLGSYGTGAIMAVPAHDERDFEFAKKFNLEIRQVIAPRVVDMENPPQKGKKDTERNIVHCFVRNKNGKIIALRSKKFPWLTPVTGGVEEGEDPVSAGIREIREETGYKNVKLIGRLSFVIQAEFYAAHKDVNRKVLSNVLIFELINEDKEEISEEEKSLHEIEWLDIKDLNKLEPFSEKGFVIKWFESGDYSYTDEGVLINSGKFNSFDSEKAKWEITKFVGGNKKIQYRLRDWSVSRQRYWGVPIPMIYCDNCGVVPVTDNDLPVVLPKLENYRPRGVAPLASSEGFLNVKCPNCKKDARRDAETLDTFVDSSWYFLRYTDPHNDKQFADKEKIDYWMGCRLAPLVSPELRRSGPEPCVGGVDLYIIGAEHATLHLLYARFITKFLHDTGYLNFAEPFLKLRHQGLILGADGQKMSKSKGNVMNPDELVESFGADTVRLYEMFMGPFEQGQPWDSKGVLGTHRFLNRAWDYILKTADKQKEIEKKFGGRFWEERPESLRRNRFLQRTIKKVQEDIESLKFNTAISALMIALNYFGEVESEEGWPKQGEAILSPDDLALFIKILNPFAPHMAQELWSQLGHDTCLDFEKWPKYDEALIKEEKIILVVQVNGKFRDSFEVDVNISKEDAEKLALASEKIKAFLGGKAPKNVIYVPGKLVNVVV